MKNELRLTEKSLARVFVFERLSSQLRVSSDFIQLLGI